jgi:hypothetical protein
MGTIRIRAASMFLPGFNPNIEIADSGRADKSHNRLYFGPHKTSVVAYSHLVIYHFGKCDFAG